MLWPVFLVIALGAALLSVTLHRRLRLVALITALGGGAAFAAACGLYELRKLAAVLVMPPGLVWMAMSALCFALARRRTTRAMALAATVVWLAYSTAGNPWLSRALAGWLEGEYSRIDAMEVEHLDAVLVLGGGLTSHDGGQIFLSNGGDRVMLGARLYLAGRCDVLISSGPEWPPGAPTTTIPELTAMLWQELGVEAEDIELIEGPRTTSEEISALAELMQSRTWQRVGLVSSATHLPRALRLARRHDLALAPLPADFRSTTLPLRPRDLVPQGDSFADISRVSWEILGRAVGR